MGFEFWAIILIFLSILTLLFPHVNGLSLFHPKFFYQLNIQEGKVILKAPFKTKIITGSEITSLSLGSSLRSFWLRLFFLGSGYFSIRIATNSSTYYIIKSPFSTSFGPALSREEIKKLLIINPNIKLDEDLRTYLQGSIADLYINKRAIKRGLIITAGLIIFLLLVGLFGKYIKF